MVLDEAIIRILMQNIENELTFLKGNVGKQTGLKEKWMCEDETEFLHGLVIGRLLGGAFGTARTLLGRKPDDKEMEQITAMVDSVKGEVKDLLEHM